MFEQLREQAYEANMKLFKSNLVILTWGNASVINRDLGYLAIKPSGVEYDSLRPEDIVIVDLEGNKISGELTPSSDTATHIELYKAFKTIGSVVHTHSSWATSWAQAERPIPCYGTTHADCFYGEIPCTEKLQKKDVQECYEKNTGLEIVRCFKNKDPMNTPGVLCANHGVFTWGSNAMDAIKHAIVLEEVAKMAYRTESLNPNTEYLCAEIQDKHFYRKHGKGAYYGQDNISKGGICL